MTAESSTRKTLSGSIMNGGIDTDREEGVTTRAPDN